jgi:hypothetical protein
VTREQLADEIHQRLGYRRLSRLWAKAEILLGLSAAGVGVFLGQYAVTQPPPSGGSPPPRWLYSSSAAIWRWRGTAATCISPPTTGSFS